MKPMADNAPLRQLDEWDEFVAKHANCAKQFQILWEMDSDTDSGSQPCQVPPS